MLLVIGKPDEGYVSRSSEHVKRMWHSLSCFCGIFSLISLFWKIIGAYEITLLSVCLRVPLYCCKAVACQTCSCSNEYTCNNRKSVGWGAFYVVSDTQYVVKSIVGDQFSPQLLVGISLEQYFGVLFWADLWPWRKEMLISSKIKLQHMPQRTYVGCVMYVQWRDSRSNRGTGILDLSIMLMFQTTQHSRNQIFVHVQVKRLGIICVVAQSLVQWWALPIEASE
jgi:hypothetical protein